MDQYNIDKRIKDFQKRRFKDGDLFCRELYDHAAIRLMAHKYAYYVCNEHFITDDGYNAEERSWYVMGQALGILGEDETSPCIDFDYKHPLAAAGIKLAGELKFSKG